ncbi:MAG: class I SAM-dependent methyltransferase [bacterium]
MLPEPTIEQLEHSEQLRQLIIDDIAERQGWIGFDRFMHLALYAPGLGYYSGPMTKLGEQGDFITAPLMGRLFGRCVARQCAQVIANMTNPSIFEFGAGDGSLAVSVLEELDALGVLPDRYFILETSAELKQRQHRAVGCLSIRLQNRVQWLDQLPGTIHGIVLANELLDALPCKRFKVDSAGTISELGVSLTNNQFTWSKSSREIKNIDWLQSLNLKQDYHSELPLQAASWVETVAELIDQGLMLLIDYGFPRQEFYHSDRAEGTLMCHYRHHSHPDPFYLPGLQDITAHIDFTAIANAGIRGGLDLAGFCDQANFLLSCGLIDILADSQSKGEPGTKEMLTLSAEVKKLTMPHEMGDLFKVIALCKGIEGILIGFKMRNHAGRLLNE